MSVWCFEHSQRLCHGVHVNTTHWREDTPLTNPHSKLLYLSPPSPKNPPATNRFYAPQVFVAAGQSTSNALLSAVIIGLVNVAATGVAAVAVDRAGRRFLLLQGGAQMIVTQVRGVSRLFCSAHCVIVYCQVDYLSWLHQQSR